jgi:hypothetical protein
LHTIAAACSIVCALLFGITPGQAVGGQVKLAWDANAEPDVTGYKIFTGSSSGVYGAPISVGKVTTYTVTGLGDGQTYYFALTAVDSYGNESGYSTEVVHTTPASPEINLLGNGAGIPDGDATPAAADGTDFGSADIAAGTVTRTFTIQNTGSGVLHLSGSPLVAVGGANAAEFTVSALPAASVAAAGSTSFQVTFDPSAAGVRSATLSIANDDTSENPYDFAVQGSGGISPEIDVLGSATSIPDGDTTPAAGDDTDFGSADIGGATVTRTFTIRNTGSGALALSGTPRVIVSGANAAEFKVVVLPAASVAAGAATTFQVRFDPAAVGTRAATISIANNDADEKPYNFAVQGTATSAPEIDVFGNAVAIPDGDTTPAAGDFTDFGGADIAGGTVARTFVIKNAGSIALALSGTPRVVVGGPNAADFTVTVLPTATVAAAKTTTFQVRFDPGGTGTRTATISIPSSDADENPYDFAIQGTGTVAPEILVLGNGLNILDGDATPAATDHTHFGAVDIVGGTLARTFTIQNAGSGTLSLSGSPRVAIGGAGAADYTVSVLPADTVSPGGSTSFQVTFDPSVAGGRAATLTIPNDDANENPFNLSILGTGALIPEMDVLGDGVSIADGDTTPADFTDFGSADIGGQTVTRTFTIRNTGSGALALSGTPRVALGAPNATDFAVVALPAASVAAGGSTTFQLRFDPKAVGPRVATVSIANNDPDERPYNFAVQGMGTSVPEINVLGNALSIADGDTTPEAGDLTDFGSADIAGGSVTRTFTVKNTGSGALALTGTPLVALSGPNAADFYVKTLPLASLAAAGSTTFQVTFDPSAAGARGATVTIANGDADENPYDFSILGTGTIAPEINLLGNGLAIVNNDATPAATDHTDFGSADVAGGTVTRTFTIRNTGSGPLTLSGAPLVAVGGVNAADFTVTALPSDSVAPAGSTTFQVTFDPGASGARLATLSIASNDANESAYVFTIRGTGAVVPEIDISGNGTSIVDGDTTPAAEDATDFGTADIAGGTVTHTFTIHNSGSGALSLSGTPRVALGATNAADFKVAVLPTGSVAAGASTTFQITFNPSGPGARVATVSIPSNDPNENPYNFALLGSGVASGSGSATLASEAAAAGSTLETLSRPTAPSGPASPAAGVAYTFSTHGALSSSGDPVQYRFSWADGTSSDWLPVGVLEASKTWAVAGSYTQVQAQARCARHPSVVSPVSSPVTVTVTAGAAGAAESIGRPGTPAGPASLTAMTAAVFRAGGAASSSLDAVQYRFHWSDGTMSAWLPAGVREASKSWSAAGSYEVRVEARCALHPSVVSSPSAPLLVDITPGIDESLVEPESPVGTADGQTGVLYAFDAKGASTSVGDPVQYRFQWGDGTTSGWISAAEAAAARAWKFWAAEGRYSVAAEARCSVHNGLKIPSAPVEVQILRGDPELFFDTFAGGPAVDDSRWQIMSGGWVLTAEETFTVDAPRVDSLAVVRPLPEFRAGRLATRLRLGASVPGDYLGLVFAYTDAQHYRYVALGDGNLFLGQVGESGGEADGIKATVRKAPAPGAWHQLRVDLDPDGTVKVFLGQAEQPALVFRFAEPLAGQVGFTTNTAEVAFDDFGMWDERVLLP